MKLTFKDLKQQKFVIEAEPSELISDVKEKISKEKGWEVSLQKLIYSGKILQDANTVESYKIEEKGFIVCMVAKPKAAPAPVASSSQVPSTPTPAVTSTPAPPAAPLQASNTSSNQVPSTPSPAGVTASAPVMTSTPAAGSGGLSMGAERTAQIAEMEAMGFERTQIDLAMRAAYYNGERAIEYLLNGIPAGLQQERAPPAGNQAASSPPPPPPVAASGDAPVNLFEAAAAGQGRGGGARGLGGAGGLGGLGAGLGAGAGAGAGAEDENLGNLEFLRDNPQFQQLRQVVQQNPAMLEAILAQVAAGNPQLAQMIAANQAQFMQLLSENGDDDAPLPPGAQTIDVTVEEQAAIERLVLLGFPRDQAIQAYFACDKNEELAANFLFDQPDDDDMMG